MISGMASRSKEDVGEKVSQTSADRIQPPSTLSPLQAASIQTQPKASPSSTEIMRNRMAFFSVPSQPVRINAKAFLGLEPVPPSEPAEKQEGKIKDVSEKPLEVEEKSTELAEEEQVAALTKEADSSRKRHGRREPTERAKRWRKRRKKRRVTGHVTGGAVAEKHSALPVVSIEGASSDEDEDVDLDVDLANTGHDVIDKDQELEPQSVSAVGDVDESKRHIQVNAGNERQLEIDFSSVLRDESHLSGGDVVEEHRQSEDAEEASITICDAADDLSESESESVDELCMKSEDNDDDVNEKEYLVDGRTINYEKLFADESKNDEDFDVDLCQEEQQQVVDNVVSSFRKIGDVQSPTDVADLPLTQSEERLLMFGWKEGMVEDNEDEVSKVDEDTTATDEVVQDSGTEFTFEVKDDDVKVSDSAGHDSAQSNDSSNPSEHKRSYQPPSKSPNETSVAPVSAEKLAPHADVDSFSDDDLELCITVPSYSPTNVKLVSSVADTAVENKVPTTDMNVASSHCDAAQTLNTSSNLESRVATDVADSANLSDVAIASISSNIHQQTIVSKTALPADIDEKTSSDEDAQLSTQPLPQDLSVQSVEATDFVPLHIDVEETHDVMKKDVSSPGGPVAPLSADSSRVAKLDPVARIDRLLESLSSSRIGPISPSLLQCDDNAFLTSKQQLGEPEMNCDFPEAQHFVSPFSRLDRLADTSALDHSAEVSDAKDESHIVEFRVEDQSGVEHSFRVDESFVSTRDRRQQQLSEKESLSDVSFSATESAADQSIVCKNSDESSSSGTREVATCPAALMVATDDSLSLDRLASFSFDDVLSVDNVDGEDDSQDRASMEAMSKPVCNGTLHGEVDLVSSQPQKELRAAVVDAATGKDSPPVAVISPSRLVDAKRRFFCEAPQPVRIDPRRVFDEIPAHSSTSSKSQGASADQTSKPQRVNGLTSEAAGFDENSAEKPRRRVLPALPSDEPPIDTSQLVLSIEEIALIKKLQQRTAQAGEKSSPTAVDDASVVQRRPHRTERKRPSSALVVTATERDKMDSCGPSPQTVSAIPKPSAVRQSSYSDSTTDGSPSQRRDRIWAFHRSKSGKTKPPGEPASSGDTENSGGSDRKDKKRSLLALLMPSKSVDRRIKLSKDVPPLSPQPSAGDVTTTEPSIDRAEMIAAIREKTKSLPLEKKKLPSASAADAAKRASLEKQRSKSSKMRGTKKSESERDGRSKQPQRTVYEEMAPIIEGIKRVERRNRDKVNIHDRIRAVAPPPPKAPFTALLPPKADSKCLRSFSA